MEHLQALFQEDPEFCALLTLCLVGLSWLGLLCLGIKQKKEGDKNG